MKTRVFLIMLSMVASIHAAPLLGPAAEYNAFIFDEMDVSYSDVEGKVAVGGNATMSHYSVGLKASPSDYALVGGADVAIYNGGVNNGGIYAEGNVAINPAIVQGDVDAKGSVSAINSPVSGTVSSSVIFDGPVDFADAYTQLDATSEDLKNLTVNATTTMHPWDYLIFSGDHSADVSVFNVTASQLNTAWGVEYDLDSDDLAIINVAGTSININNMDFNVNNSGVGKQERILYNFFEATEIFMSGVGFKGSILAPHADFQFNNGVLEGSIIANSFTGSGQINAHYYQGTVDVPEPATTAMLGLGIGLLGLFFFTSNRKRQSV